jgi:hypothetical protein
MQSIDYQVQRFNAELDWLGKRIAEQESAK